MLPGASQGRKLIARLLAASVVGLLMVGPAAPPAGAAAACTDWVHLAGARRDYDQNNANDRKACVRDVENQASQGGYRSQTTLDTLFFWFGDDVVTARCLTRTLVVFSSYDYRAQDACPLLNQIKNTVRHQ
jgi:hypothetical protein